MTGTHRAPDSPAQIVNEALLEPVPCPTCARTEPCRCDTDQQARTHVMVQRIIERLTGAGHLAVDHTHTEPTLADIEATAQWLAEQSRHPRYTQVPEGWRQLVESEHNVTHAHAAATKAAQPATSQMLADLGAAKTVLIRWIESANRRADDN